MWIAILFLILWFVGCASERGRERVVMFLTDSQLISGINVMTCMLKQGYAEGISNLI